MIPKPPRCVEKEKYAHIFHDSFLFSRNHVLIWGEKKNKLATFLQIKRIVAPEWEYKEVLRPWGLLGCLSTLKESVIVDGLLVFMTISQDNTNPVVVSCVLTSLETLRRNFYLNMIFSAGSTLKVVPNKTVFKTKIIILCFLWKCERNWIVHCFSDNFPACTLQKFSFLLSLLYSCTFSWSR